MNITQENKIIKQALTILAKRHNTGKKLGSSDDTKDYLQIRYADYKNEVFSVMFLDNRHRVIDFVDLFQGTIDGASVYPRVVVQKALELNAAAVIFSHNHPSGIAEPSMADKHITKRLQSALETVDIRVLDHMVVGNSVVSFAEEGWI